jgi:hypothetical protein
MKVFALLVVLSLAFVGAASAGIPSASTSTVERVGEGTPTCNPDTAVVCPASDMGWVKVTVTVRNIYGDPLPDETVTCTAVPVAPAVMCFCPGENPQVGVTDENGVVVFYFTDFGGCGDLEFYAECQGVVLGPSPPIYIASPDNNGDCVVNLVDFGNFATGYFTSEACHDYNCDGIVDLVDFGIFATHYLHTCPP